MDKILRSNEGGRAASISDGGGTPGRHEGGKRKSNPGHEPSRVEASPGYPGAADTESMQYMISSAAETIMKHSPTYESEKRGVEAKLKKAIDSVCNGD